MLIDAEPYVRVNKFSGEGTGVCLSFDYDWQIGELLSFELTSTLPMTVEARFNQKRVGACTTDGRLEQCISFVEDCLGGAKPASFKYSNPPCWQFRCDVRILESCPRTFFVPIQFGKPGRGYFGVQDTDISGQRPKRVLFSVWDEGSLCKVDQKVTPDYRYAHCRRRMRVSQTDVWLNAGRPCCYQPFELSIGGEQPRVAVDVVNHNADGAATEPVKVDALIADNIRTALADSPVSTFRVATEDAPLVEKLLNAYHTKYERV